MDVVQQVLTKFSFLFPPLFFFPRWGVDVVRKYDETIVKLNGSLWHPLHFYSYYAGTNQQEWDEIVLRHVGGLSYQPGSELKKNPLLNPKT